jgi:uncharacterized cupin superfamily protein
MNRRTILAILTGGATILYSRFASAGNSDPSSPILSWSASRLNGKASRASTEFPDLKSVGADRQVRSIAYSRGAYSVTMADGETADFLEGALRFKVDSGDLGPRAGTPVILPAGTEGDRFWVFFASPEEISLVIRRS